MSESSDPEAKASEAEATETEATETEATETEATEAKAADAKAADAELAPRPPSEPPARPAPSPEPPSSFIAPPASYPDDGPLSSTLRTVDHYAGVVLQVALFGLLATVVLVGAAQAFATKAFKHSFPWSFDVIRAGTFTIAMLAAAFASQQARHLTMDLVSRKVAPKTRQIIRIVLGLFTIGATSLLLASGLRLREKVAEEGGSHTIPPELSAAMIPIACALIIFHTALHVAIELDYLRRGKQTPEQAPSGH